MTLDLTPDELEVIMESNDSWQIQLDLVGLDLETPIDLTGLTAIIDAPLWFTAAISDPVAGQVVLDLKPTDSTRKTNWKLLLNDESTTRVAVIGTVFVK